MAVAPVTPSVLDWAIRESGHSYEEVAGFAKVDLRKLKAVLAGEAQLNFGEFTRIQKKLKRPSATFFLPEPPQSSEEVAYRVGPEGASHRTPAERIAIRLSLQIQDLLVAVLEELRVNVAPLPRFGLDDDPTDAAAETREWLDIPEDEHTRHDTPAKMFSALRDYLGKHRVFTLTHSVGSGGARGFALPHEVAPIIGISTSVWTDGVRSYTLLHELAHLVTRDPASCGDAIPARGDRAHPSERWAERFAANFLMPENRVRETLRTIPHGTVKQKMTRLSNHHHTSRQAAFVRLIELGDATWEQYRDHYSRELDFRKGGGRPTELQTRRVKRRRMLGQAAIELIEQGLHEEVLSPLEVERVVGASTEELLSSASQ